MGNVTRQLIPQIQAWISTGKVAKGKILHPGITEARAIVKNKIGKKVEFGLKYLITRLGGGYILGKLVLSTIGESKMPIISLDHYQEIFGSMQVPELSVYDRGGWCGSTIRSLSRKGVMNIGIQPKGKAEWLVSEEVQEQVMSERAKTEGVIGTLKTEKYGFNNPKERKWTSLQGSGLRSILSFNLNKFMRDLVQREELLNTQIAA